MEFHKKTRQIFKKYICSTIDLRDPEFLPFKYLLNGPQNGISRLRYSRFVENG